MHSQIRRERERRRVKVTVKTLLLTGCLINDNSQESGSFFAPKKKMQFFLKMIQGVPRVCLGKVKKYREGGFALRRSTNRLKSIRVLKAPPPTQGSEVKLKK